MFHFIYNGKNFYYNYKTHWITLENYNYCPTCVDIHELLQTTDDNTRVMILSSVLHAYNHGYLTGQDDKLNDIRRVLGVNFN